MKINTSLEYKISYNNIDREFKGKFIYVNSENKKSIFVCLNGLSFKKIYVVFVRNKKEVKIIKGIYYLLPSDFKKTRLPSKESNYISSLINKNNNVRKHITLTEDLEYELMFGDCMLFSIFLNSKIKNNKNGVVAFVERGYKNGTDLKDGYIIEKGLVVHVGYKLNNGMIIDAQNIYLNDYYFEMFCRSNFDILLECSYYESNTNKILEYFPYINENNYFKLSKDAINHGNNLLLFLKENYLI